MRIRIQSEDELKDMAVELLHISYNLRHWTKLWNEHFGGYYGRQKKIWEKKMDDYLEKLGMEKTDNIANVHISIKENDSENKNETV